MASPRARNLSQCFRHPRYRWRWRCGQEVRGSGGGRPALVRLLDFGQKDRQFGEPQEKAAPAVYPATIPNYFSRHDGPSGQGSEQIPGQMVATSRRKVVLPAPGWPSMSSSG